MTHISRRKFTLGLAALPLIPATAAHAASHNVTIQGFAFSPATLTVKAGDTVTFTNADGAPHTATARDDSFDTGRLNKGKSAEVTLNTKGGFDYFCRFHPNMTATITVT